MTGQQWLEEVEHLGHIYNHYKLAPPAHGYVTAPSSTYPRSPTALVSLGRSSSFCSPTCWSGPDQPTFIRWEYRCPLPPFNLFLPLLYWGKG